ncbi:MAG: hypothetical protein AB9842_07740 [Bacteroidales bacterium]
MKFSNLLFHKKTVLLGFAGMLLSAYYLGYSSGSSAPPAGLNPVNLQDARRFTQNYQKSNPYVMNGPVNALVIDMDQYNAMTQVMQNTVSAAGFRLYYGRDDNNNPLCIVAGIGGSGRDITTYLISTSSGSSGICPPVCDSPSGTLGE